MAKNYTLKEAVEIIAAGKDLESISELGKRFPVLAVKVAAIAAKAGEEFVDLMGYMPEHLTANKVNTVIKNSFAGEATESDEDADEDATAEENTTEANSSDYESMSGKELVKLLRKAGKGKLITSKKKSDLVELCKKELGTKAADEDAEDVDVENDAEVEENPYEGKTAMELFKECKKRGIKAEAKKSAKFYTDLLVKDDAENAVEEDADTDDWDDEEEEAPKAEKKSTKKADKKAEKKAAKKVEAEDDDDDWDI